MNGRPYTVVVTGSRNYPHAPVICAVLGERLDQHGSLRVVEGGARGADRIAASWASQWHDTVVHVEHEQYPADWKAHSRAAGMIRNRTMLDSERPDEVLAFPFGESRGTYGCIHEARLRGIPVTVAEVQE